MIIDVTAEQVRATLVQYVNRLEPSAFPIFGPPDDMVARLLGWDGTPPITDYRFDRFRGQLRRAIKEQIDLNRLVRSDRRGHWNTALYYTPDAWEAELAKRKASEAEAARVAEAWGEIGDILIEHGFEPYMSTLIKGRPVTLSLEGWARLMECLPFDAKARQPVIVQKEVSPSDYAT